MMKALKASLLAVFGFSWLAPAQAADVPTGLIVEAGGYEWAWAAPCAPAAPSCGNVPLVMHDGWAIADAAQFAASFSGYADLVADFNGGSKCASAYFNSGYSHCDGSDAASGYVWNAPAAWPGGAGNAFDNFYDEVFVVRGGGGRVPEPATITLLALGLLGAGLAARRQRR